MNRTVELKNIGLIKSGVIDIKKINIIIGRCMKSEVMQLLYWLLYIEKKMYNIINLQEDHAKENPVQFINDEFKRNYTRLVQLIQSPLKIKKDGYVKYKSDWLEFTIYSDRLEVINLIWDSDLPDFLWYNSDPYFPINRDQTLNPKFPVEWLDITEPSYYFKMRMQGIISELALTNHKSDEDSIQIMNLCYHGYSDFFLKKKKDDLGSFCTKAMSVPKNKINKDGYVFDGEFFIERENPHQILSLQDGLNYLIPIVLTIEKRIADEIVDSVFIEQPELGLFLPVANLLIKNLIDDIALRKSESTDQLDVDLNWRPTIFMTTNSELVVNSVLEDSGGDNTKLPKGAVNIVAIKEDVTTPLEYTCNSISEESINDIYNSGLDCFYNIEGL